MPGLTSSDAVLRLAESVCGRFTTTAELALLAERFSVELPEQHRQRFNVAPTQNVLALRAPGARREALMMRWGLVPCSARDVTVGNRMINARAETLREKRTYRTLLEGSRCLIPADGFYEWRVGRDGKKEPIRFTLTDGSLFALAGLWTTWVNRQTKEVLDSCTIVTTRPNSVVAPVHDRMPVIVSRDAEDLWLDPTADLEQAMSLLLPYPSNAMTQHVASRAINVASNDSAEILVPAADELRAA